MTAVNKVIGFISIIISLGIITTSLGYGYEWQGAPGPGFVPFWAGVLIGVLGILMVIREMMAKSPRKSLFTREEIWQAAGGILSCTAGMLIAQVTGILIALGLTTVSIYRILGGKRWLTTCLLLIGTPLVIYLLFSVGLKLPLPQGYLGI
ncbi:MAG: tripartite tricarboxylate transporter TctB family protein [Moorella humiferrea]|nr:tripartite tricarboxylate transporter TctB family protein [Moorella humiferrea]